MAFYDPASWFSGDGPQGMTSNDVKDVQSNAAKNYLNGTMPDWTGYSDQGAREAKAMQERYNANQIALTASGNVMGGQTNQGLAAIDFSQLADTNLAASLMAQRNTILSARAQPGIQGTLLSNPVRGR